MANYYALSFDMVVDFYHSYPIADEYRCILRQREIKTVQTASIKLIKSATIRQFAVGILDIAFCSGIFLNYVVSFGNYSFPKNCSTSNFSLIKKFHGIFYNVDKQFHPVLNRACEKFGTNAFTAKRIVF